MNDEIKFIEEWEIKQRNYLILEDLRLPSRPVLVYGDESYYIPLY